MSRNRKATEDAERLTALAADPNRTAGYKAVQAAAAELSPAELLAARDELERIANREK